MDGRVLRTGHVTAFGVARVSGVSRIMSFREISLRGPFRLKGFTQVSDNSFTSLQHPNDLTYRLNRQKLLNELLKMSPQQLDLQIQYQMRQQAPKDESNGALTKSIIGEMYNAPYVPESVKGILDSTSGTTGNVLIRQDLEAPMYAYAYCALAE